MAQRKSLEYSEVFIALLRDVQTLHSNCFTTSDLRKTLSRVTSRISSEGLSFLTKTLPSLGKAFDKALAEVAPLDAVKLRFKPLPNSKLPKFLGELFRQVLSDDGTPLQNASVACVQSIRQLLFVFYKLELPNDPKLDQRIISEFERTEDEVRPTSEALTNMASATRNSIGPNWWKLDTLRKSNRYPLWWIGTVESARIELNTVLSGFDFKDIFPRHGPGAVSTKEQLWEKYTWTSIPSRLTDVYPADEYFYASQGHVCDSYQQINKLISDHEPFARVCLVPKDSRGPRLISCEPLVFQWIQQGIARSLVAHVERHPHTRESVRFTDQQPNQFGALYGSKYGSYATLDLKEASDRVSLGLVRLLFPEGVIPYLEAARSLGTELPDGKTIKLHKYAPMGSALCFPILALTVWSLLKGGFRTLGHDRNGEVPIYVYGDDVIVPTAYAEHAMTILESFGLKINRDKSCTKGFFRESCGMDAYKGHSVTPVRFRTPWSSTRRPESYYSWIAYANSCYDRKYVHCYEYIVERLVASYGAIPTQDLWPQTNKPLSASKWTGPVPALPYIPEQLVLPKIPTRTNVDEQRRQYKVWSIEPVTECKTINGWEMLLRYFTEGARAKDSLCHTSSRENLDGYLRSKIEERPFSVSVYTRRGLAKLVRRWR